VNGENSGIGLNVQRLVVQELKVEPEVRFKKLNMEVKNVKDLRLSSVLARYTFAQWTEIGERGETGPLVLSLATGDQK
jgi:hypothetical protein